MKSHTLSTAKNVTCFLMFSYKLCAGNEQQKQCGWNMKFSACY